MAYDFGAAASHDTTCSFIIGVGANSRIAIIAGWWRPTTLTATRGLWSAGNTVGAEIDTTTSELRLRTDNTTDGQWTTTGVGLAVGTPKFLAFALNCYNTGPAAAWRVWAGDVQTPPAEVTVTQATAPVGNFTGSTSVYFGNKGTSTTLAFQGAIEECWTTAFITTDWTMTPLTDGVINQVDADLIYSRMVLPMWAGTYETIFDLSKGERTYWNGFGLNWERVQLWSSSTGVAYNGQSINGATASQTRFANPRRMRGLGFGVRGRR